MPHQRHEGRPPKESALVVSQGLPAEAGDTVFVGPDLQRRAGRQGMASHKKMNRSGPHSGSVPRRMMTAGCQSRLGQMLGLLSGFAFSTDSSGIDSAGMAAPALGQCWTVGGGRLQTAQRMKRRKRQH